MIATEKQRKTGKEWGRALFGPGMLPDQDGRAYKAADGWIALLYYLYVVGLLYGFGILYAHTTLLRDWVSFIGLTGNMESKLLIYTVFGFLEVLPIFLIAAFRRHSLSSLGLTWSRTGLSVLIGLLAAALLNLPQIAGLINGSMTVQLEGNRIYGELLYFLICIAWVEELIFRGFIQTRLRGIIRNGWLSLLAGAVLFASMHIPFQMMLSDLSLLAFIKEDWVHLSVTGVMHFVLMYLYSRTGNLLAPTVAHGLNNYLQNYVF